jgi:hypothetical protein
MLLHPRSGEKLNMDALSGTRAPRANTGGSGSPVYKLLKIWSGLEDDLRNLLMKPGDSITQVWTALNPQ